MKILRAQKPKAAKLEEHFLLSFRTERNSGKCRQVPTWRMLKVSGDCFWGLRCSQSSFAFSWLLSPSSSSFSFLLFFFFFSTSLLDARKNISRFETEFICRPQCETSRSKILRNFGKNSFQLLCDKLINLDTASSIYWLIQRSIVT